MFCRQNPSSYLPHSPDFMRIFRGQKEVRHYEEAGTADVVISYDAVQPQAKQYCRRKARY